jgi:AhpD family alkylhydroperoxidase
VDRDALAPDARAVHDRIVESRGSLLRPFELLLHAPALADAVSSLGHLVRSGSRLADRDRELATLAAGRALGCAYVWDSHLEAATAAGIGPDALAALETGDLAALDPRDAAVAAFVWEATAGRPSDETFARVHELLGDTGTVELAVTAGYYAMLAIVMRAGDAC